jgi:hypothetical protein
LLEFARWLYIEPNQSAKTQTALIADFKTRTKAEHKRGSPSSEPSTLMPGERRFFTIYAVSGKENYRLTQDDLNRLQLGEETAFVIFEITYRDSAVTHHFRRCAWLQPPASPPRIWHFCSGFNKSD